MRFFLVVFALMAVFSGVYSATIPEKVPAAIEETNEDVQAAINAFIAQLEVANGPATMDPKLLGAVIGLLAPILGKLFG
ncbi:hypothetical protein DMENIID0001_056470 [Sergentomyia squamirostris]